MFAPELSPPSIDGLQRTVEMLNNEGYLVIGSVGRGVIFNAVLGNPQHEIDTRGEDPLHTTATTGLGATKPIGRDVDYIGGTIGWQRTIAHAPHQPDATFYGAGLWIQKHRRQDWRLRTRSRPFGKGAKISPEVFQPVEGTTLGGVTCITVRAATHLALLGNQRHKDVANRQLLEAALPESERTFMESDDYTHFENLLAAPRSAGKF